jgi:hypothetical protein
MRIFDPATWFTRKQSDNRYQRKAPNPAPPTNLVVVGAGLSADSGDPALPGYVDITLTPPAVPAFLLVPNIYIIKFRFVCTTIVAGSPVVNTIDVAANASNLYRVAGLLGNSTYSIVAKSIDFTTQVGTIASSAVSVIIPADKVAPVSPVIQAEPGSVGAIISISRYNTEPDFSHYVLMRRSGLDPFIPIITFTPADYPSGILHDFTLPSFANWVYRLTTYDVSNNSSVSNIVGVGIPIAGQAIAPPAQPDLVGSPAATASSVNSTATFTFKANTIDTSPNLVGYRILRQKSGDTEWVVVGSYQSMPAEVGSGDTISFIDTKVVVGVTYKYTALAFDSVGGYSTFDTVNAVSTAIVDATAPSAPTGPVVFSGVTGAVVAGWNPSTSRDVNSYGVSWRYGQTGSTEETSWSSEILTPNTSFQISGLVDPTTSLQPTRTDLSNEFEVRVRALDRVGNASSYLSGIVTFPELSGYTAGDNTIPPAPGTITSVINSDGTVNLSWTNPTLPDLQGYLIEQSDSVQATWRVIGTAPTSSFKAIGLEPFSFASKTYRFRVRTIDNTNNLSAVNLIYNPGFENSLVEWNNPAVDAGHVNTIITNTALTRNSSPKALQSNYAGRIANDGICLTGFPHTASVYARTDIVGGSSATVAKIRAVYLDNVSAELGASELFATAAINSNYQRIQINLPAPPIGGVKIRLELQADPLNPTWTVLWDDAQIEIGHVANTAADGHTPALHAVDTVGPIAYIPQNLVATPKLGLINLTWRNPNPLDPASVDYIDGIFEVWRRIVASNILPTSGSIFFHYMEVPSAADADVVSFDDLEPSELDKATIEYKLRPRDKYGNVGSFTSIVSAISLDNNDISRQNGDGLIPSAPVLTSAVANSDGSITVTWEESSTGGRGDLAGYLIYRKKSGDPSFSHLATVLAATGSGQQTYTDTSVDPAFTWVYTVSAFDSQLEEGLHNLTGVSVLPFDSRIPADVSGLTAKGDVGKLVYSWAAVAGVDRYQIRYRDDTAAWAWSSFFFVNGTSYDLLLASGPTKAVIKTSSGFEVKAASRSGVLSTNPAHLYGSSSEITDPMLVAYVAIDTVAPSAPGAPTVTTGDSIALVVWTASSSVDVSTYSIDVLQEGDNPSTDWTNVGNTRAPTVRCRVNGLEKYSDTGIRYKFRVTAYDHFNNASSPATGTEFVAIEGDTTPPPPTTSLSYAKGKEIPVGETVPTGAWIDLTWSVISVVDLKEYEVYCKRTDIDQPPTIIRVAHDTTTQHFGGLVLGATYTLIARGVDWSGNALPWGDVTLPTLSVTTDTFTSGAGDTTDPPDVTGTFYNSSTIDPQAFFDISGDPVYPGALPSGFAYYQIYYEYSESGFGLLSGYDTTTSLPYIWEVYEDSGAREVTWTGQIRAVKSNGHFGGWSNTVTINYCPAVDMFIREGLLAGDVIDGEKILSKRPDEILALHPAKIVGKNFQPCVRLVAANGAAIVVSDSTPVETDDKGSWKFAGSMIGQPIASLIEGQRVWTEVISVEDVGSKEVIRISLGGRSFPAGEDPRAMLFTHNYSTKP